MQNKHHWDGEETKKTLLGIKKKNQTRRERERKREIGWLAPRFFSFWRNDCSGGSCETSFFFFFKLSKKIWARSSYFKFGLNDFVINIITRPEKEKHNNN